MAKPAEKALGQILARHPAATVSERFESSVVADVGGDKMALVSSIGAMHYRLSPGDAWVGIDTAWAAATGGPGGVPIQYPMPQNTYEFA